MQMFENETMQFLKSHENLNMYSQYDAIIPCCNGHKYRPDILYVLDDRWIIVEIDEHQHKTYCAVGEFQRLHELRDQLDTHKGGMYMIVIRYNPNQENKEKLQKLGDAIRDAFTTTKVCMATSGIHIEYVGYNINQKRKMETEYYEAYDENIKHFKRVK
jgi:hypothetical protein